LFVFNGTGNDGKIQDWWQEVDSGLAVFVVKSEVEVEIAVL
jgi:hypothetical protein